MQDEMMDLMDVSTEIQESLGRSYNVPDDIDEEELMGGKTGKLFTTFLDYLKHGCIYIKRVVAQILLFFMGHDFFRPNLIFNKKISSVT